MLPVYNFNSHAMAGSHGEWQNIIRYRRIGKECRQYRAGKIKKRFFIVFRLMFIPYANTFFKAGLIF